MNFIEVLYTGGATILIMVVIQFLIFFGIKIMYPPPPRVIYRDIPMYQAPPVAPPVLTEAPKQEVKLPEYEPRNQTSDSLRLDVELPVGLQETRPPGT
jgi:hypothetical protein